MVHACVAMRRVPLAARPPVPGCPILRAARRSRLIRVGDAETNRPATPQSPIASPDGWHGPRFYESPPRVKGKTHRPGASGAGGSDLRQGWRDRGRCENGPHAARRSPRHRSPPAVLSTSYLSGQTVALSPVLWSGSAPLCSHSSIRAPAHRPCPSGCFEATVTALSCDER